MLLVPTFLAGIAIDSGCIVYSNSRILAAADVKAMAPKFFNENATAGGEFGDIKQVTIDRS
jgi:hypothetical protein